ncbi:hypothetical protein GCM10022395_33060 [Snuella lapsa]|uniref:Tetratricopeptide repeat protein n=2 Tax=Snuella lapsa TaxID=870481 RepID=A0ABP6YJT1_9FLAO
MVFDKPVLGHGINTFQSKYMPYQEKYFAEYKDDSKQHLANNNQYAFNESLKTACEQGGMGILIIVIVGYLFVLSIKKPFGNYLNLISMSGLLLILIFGFFSYPMEITQLKIMMILFIGILSKSSNKIVSIKYWKTLELNNLRNSYRIKRGVLYTIFLIVALTGEYKLYKTFIIYKNWNTALFEMKKGDLKSYITFSEKNHQSLCENGYFLGYFGKALFKEKKYVQAHETLEQALFLIPSTDICIDIGLCYKNLGEYKKAEVFWIKASNMVPSQFKPEYLIAKMYFEIGQKDKAKRIASNLLTNKKIKVYSIEVYQIIEKLKKMVEL